MPSVQHISLAATEIHTPEPTGTSLIQLWPWALGAVLLVLLIEWRVYQKKVSTPLLSSWTQSSKRQGGML